MNQGNGSKVAEVHHRDGHLALDLEPATPAFGSERLGGTSLIVRCNAAMEPGRG